MEIYGPTLANGESNSRDRPNVSKLLSRVRERGLAWGVLAFAASCCCACQPNVNIGEWTCPASTANAGTAGGAGGTSGAGEPITIPWSTGFENRFCDYQQPTGFCTSPSMYSIVTSPTNSGHYAAAFTVIGEQGGEFQQSRCVRQGVLPDDAYYGAWYFIPAPVTNHGNWNLLHFRGEESPGAFGHGLWDVSLVNGTDGKLTLSVLNFLWKGPPAAHILLGPTIPIGSWFHLEFYLKRAKDATGEAALFMNGTRVVDFSKVITDDTDWGRWYVGNWANSLTPAESTLYVDDVTIAATEGWTPPP